MAARSGSASGRLVHSKPSSNDISCDVRREGVGSRFWHSADVARATAASRRNYEGDGNGHRCFARLAATLSRGIITRLHQSAADARGRPSIRLPVIITIDGPAGAGKSTVARALAQRLGFRFLDTGAMYRAVALAGLRRGLDWDVPDDLARLARELDIRSLGERILLNGEDVSEAVRTSQVTGVTRYAAGNPQVRAFLVELQRRLANDDNVVAEGRDQGTVAFPKAELKIFLTATPPERARRRLNDLQAKGEPVTLEQVLTAQERRDREDATREVGPLVPAADAVEVLTDGLTLEQVVDRLEQLARSRPHLCPPSRSREPKT